MLYCISYHGTIVFSAFFCFLLDPEPLAPTVLRDRCCDIRSPPTACADTYTYICIYKHEHIPKMFKFSCTHMYTHTSTHILTYIHTCTHWHTNTPYVFLLWISWSWQRKLPRVRQNVIFTCDSIRCTYLALCTCMNAHAIDRHIAKHPTMAAARKLRVVPVPVLEPVLYFQP